jgi:hypothetical protein
MFKSENYKLALIAFIFALSVLVVLPKITVSVSNRLLKIDSYIGGYSPNIFGKVFDLSDFKKGIDVGGMASIVFVIGDGGTQNIEAAAQLVKQLTERRMASGGYKEYQVSISRTDGKYRLVVEFPKYVDANYLASTLIGTGNLTFKTLKNPSDWKTENVSKLAQSPESWVPTGISRSDVSDLLIGKGSSGQDQLQIVFTQEGKAKFNSIAKENVEKPVAFFINDQDFPVLIPVMDASLAGEKLVDPTLTGYFPQGFLESFLIQFKNGPLPVKLSSPQALNVPSKFGDDFMVKIGSALLAGFGFSTVYSVIRFKKKGVFLSLSIFYSIMLFLALTKVFFILVNVALIAGMFSVLLLFAERGYEVLLKMSSEDSKDKPFGYVMEKVFAEQGDTIKYLVVILFFTMLLVSRYSGSETVSFVYSVILGCLCLPYFNFVLRSLLEAYRKGK